MRRSRFRLILCSALCVATVCLIWGNSLLDGSSSGSLSGGFSAWIGHFLPFLSPDTPNGHYLLRKCAHFSIHFLLGLETCWLMSMLSHRRVFLRTLSLCACVAMIDESIQRFVPGRCGCVSDVVLDCCGAVCGILLLLAAVHVWRRSKHAAPQ